MTSRYLDDLCATLDEEYEGWVSNITEIQELDEKMIKIDKKEREKEENEN